MSSYDGRPSKQEREREKTKSMIIAFVFIFALMVIALFLYVGVTSPRGLEGYFQSLWSSFLTWLDELRWNLDIYFRYFKSIFAR